MKALHISLLVIILGVSAGALSAQDKSNASENAADLRLKLLEVQSMEAELKGRAQQLDEDMKPENIEKFFAGVGSTRPEELREQRRRQLAIERDGVRRQLELLAASRVRLETAVVEADNLAYQQSAQATDTLLNRVGVGNLTSMPRLVIGVGVVVLVAGIALFTLMRRLRV